MSPRVFWQIDRVLVCMLGPFQVRDREGGALPLSGARMPAFLARLALSPGRAVPARTLLEDLWEGDPPDGGADTLRRLASRTRARLSEHGIEAGPFARHGGYLLDLSAEEIDTFVFERLAAEGARLLGEHAPERADRALEEALQLWRGEPFGGVEAEFASLRAPRLHELRTTALEDRADAACRTGDPDGALPGLRALCAAHPARERCHGLLMRALHESGRSAEALTVHEDLRRNLAEELGADPSSWIGKLHGEILRGQAPARPAEWTNPYLTRFFGRQKELAEIEALGERTRLVTLLGPGGVGKTRLAAEHAARIAGHAADTAGRTAGTADRVGAATDRDSGTATHAAGTAAPAAGRLRVHFVELGSLREGDSLVEAVAAMPGAGEAPLSAPGRDRLSRLVSALSAVPTLLVLDNCEHLADDAAVLADRLLAQCPDLRILTTSREPLATDGEGLVRVEPLEVPDTEGGEAVAMFAELASLARPGFTADAETGPVVAEICRRLDGLPLGIELAAARTRSMTVQQIAHHLDERFRLLSGIRRAANDRHRTLRAVLDWTWNLLTEQERQLARRLSVLPGGATVGTARAVCADRAVPEEEVPFLLSSLTDKSLLSTTEPRPGEPRHRLLETARVYLAEHLSRAGEEERVRAAAARYAAGLAEEAFAMLLGRDQARGLALLDGEHDNLVEGLRHACGGGDPALAVRITVALSWYWIIRGRYEEAERWYGELDRHPQALTPAARTLASAVRSILPRTERSEQPGGGARFGDAGRPSDRTGPGLRTEGRPGALTGTDIADTDTDTDSADTAAVLAEYPPLAMITPKRRLLEGDLDGLRTDAEAALAHPHPWVRAAGLAASALAVEAERDAAGAERDTQAASEAFWELGDAWTSAQLVTALAGFRSARGDVDGAISSLRQALELERALGASEQFTYILIRLGDELLRARDLREAAETFRSALDTALTTEHRILSLAGLAELELLRERFEAARDLLARARELLSGPLADPDYLRVVLLCREGEVALAQGGTARARSVADLAWETARALGLADVRARTAELLAQVLREEGDPVAAARALGTAARLRGRRDEGNPGVRASVRDLAVLLGQEGFERAYAEGASESAPPSG